MKVHGSRPQSPGPMPSETAKTGASAKPSVIEGAAEAKSAKVAGIGSNARVDVSPKAQEMAKAKELATPSDDIDEAKVARLQKMIDEGKYKIDANSIADRLLDEHSKMP